MPPHPQTPLEENTSASLDEELKHILRKHNVPYWICARLSLERRTRVEYMVDKWDTRAQCKLLAPRQFKIRLCKHGLDTIGSQHARNRLAMAWEEANETAIRRKACMFGHQTMTPGSGPAMWDPMAFAFRREANEEADQAHDPSGKLPKPEWQGSDLLLNTLFKRVPDEKHAGLRGRERNRAIHPRSPHKSVTPRHRRGRSPDVRRVGHPTPQSEGRDADLGHLEDKPVHDNRSIMATRQDQAGPRVHQRTLRVSAGRGSLGNGTRATPLEGGESRKGTSGGP